MTKYEVTVMYKRILIANNEEQVREGIEFTQENLMSSDYEIISIKEIGE